MKINPFVSLLLAISFVLVIGCKTNFTKLGATDADFHRDLALAEGHAASVIQSATVMPAKSGLEAMMRGITVPIMKRHLINDYMKQLGWVKTKNGYKKRVTTTDSSINGVQKRMDDDIKRLFPNKK